MDATQPEPELLEHLVVEFGDYGRQAVEFLATARRLLLFDEQPEMPRTAESVAYNLREAMKRLLQSQTVSGAGGMWRDASRAVVDARERYERTRGVPGEDEVGALQGLLLAIDDLQAVHEQAGVHEQRLIAIMVARTGALPLASGTAPIRRYQELLGELDSAVHGEATLVC